MSLIVFIVSIIAAFRLSLAFHTCSPTQLTCPRRIAELKMAYIPDGLSVEEYRAMKKKESEALRNLGKIGTTKFKSRSFQAFHESLESGDGGHLYPVDPRLVREGKIKLSEVPYMQRGGSWDDSDLVNKEKGIKQKKWTASDKMYASGGEAANQSVNIFGRGANLPWQGQNPFKMKRTDPVEEQKKWKRASSVLPPNKAALARVERERAELEKKSKQKANVSEDDFKANKRFFLF